ncbi:hypothetical protein DSECCO2_624430 [anaerobic digester metagenome]
MLEDVAVLALRGGEALHGFVHGPAEARQFPAQPLGHDGVVAALPGVAQAHARGIAFEPGQGQDDAPAHDQRRDQSQGGVEAQDAQGYAGQGRLEVAVHVPPRQLDLHRAHGLAPVADLPLLGQNAVEGRLARKGGGPPAAVPDQPHERLAGAALRDHDRGNALVLHDPVEQLADVVLFQKPQRLGEVLGELGSGEARPDP